MAFEQILQDIKDRNFDFDFHKMTLKKRGLGDRAFFMGKGYVRSAKNGELIFKLYVEVFEGSFGGLLSDAVGGLLSGQILPEDHFYDFEACDGYGNNWTAKRILPDWNRGHDGTYVACGVLSTLCRKQSISFSEYSQKLYFFEEIQDSFFSNFHLNLLNCEFSINHEQGEIIISVVSDRELPHDINLRVSRLLKNPLRCGF